MRENRKVHFAQKVPYGGVIMDNDICGKTDTSAKTFAPIFKGFRSFLPSNFTLDDVGCTLVHEDDRSKRNEASRILVATLKSADRQEQTDALVYLLVAENNELLNEYFRGKIDAFMANHRKNSEIITVANARAARPALA